jgi:hypothetical protein
MIFAACGSDALGNGDGGTDMSANGDMSKSGDLAVQTDMAYTLRMDGGTISCGAASCTGGDKCCIQISQDGGTRAMTSCAASCPAQDVTIECRSPEDCSGLPCCATIDVAGMSLSDVSCAAALTDCKPAFSGNLVTRLCDIDADCTAGAPKTTLNQCCSASFMGQSQKICLNSTLAGLAGGGITCP